MSAVESSCMPSSAFPCPLSCLLYSNLAARTAVVFAVVGNHKHDLPFENVIPNETAADAGDVLVALHELELATQKPGGC